MYSKEEQKYQQEIENLEIAMEVLNKLSKNKKPIIIKDGKAELDSAHSDYKYWTHD